jgi:exodeoxyribonuclease V alpha subunit
MSAEYHERAIDRHFAEFICGQAGSGSDDLFRLLVSLASNAVGKGSSCLDLASLAGQSVIVRGSEHRLPKLEALKDLLMSSAAVGIHDGPRRPLVLDASGRLYLYRFWSCERELAGMILRKAGDFPRDFDEAQVHESLLRLFPGDADSGEDRQKRAAEIASGRLFTVISGGPGTGKTSTVVRILALLLEQPGEGRKIALATPTGKAAARLRASINGMKGSLDCPAAVRSAIPENVVTIHTLLGPISGSAHFRHSPKNLLPFDTVVIDEASMISLPLMHALVSAMRPDARLVLLGDRDQLASVEAGTVFSDICKAAADQPDSPLGQCSVVFDKNFRFSETEGIQLLSRLVIDGKAEEASELIRSSPLPGFFWHSLPAMAELKNFLAPRVISGYRNYLEKRAPEEALSCFNRFMILTAFRQGSCGVSGLNREAERILSEQGLVDPSDVFYRGRPVLITTNDYTMRLFNGDCGILLPDPENGDEIRAFFPSNDGGSRSFPPERLPGHETAYAMTVHKSQGSEYDSVLLVLPSSGNELLSRELLYTGLTRARHSVELLADESVFSAAVRKKSERNSGLGEMLSSFADGERNKSPQEVGYD